MSSSSPLPILSNELLHHIVSLVDKRTAVTCLRVSKSFFTLAGKIVYRDLVINGLLDVDGLFLGADIVNKRSEKDSPKKTNFKRQLLQLTESVEVHPHVCPRQRADRSARTKAARLLNHLDRVTLVPPYDIMLTESLCDPEEHGECPIVKGFKCKKATIQDITVDGPEDGPLELFPTLLKPLEQLTLVLPPTAFSIHPRFPISGRPEDLSYATKHIKSIRLIVASPSEDLDEQNADMCQLEPLVAFLAETVVLHPAAFDIYIFPSFNGKFNPADFYQSMMDEVEKQRTRIVEVLQSQDKLTEEITGWHPRVTVGGIVDYFGDAKRVKELDAMWAMLGGYMGRGCVGLSTFPNEPSGPAIIKDYAAPGSTMKDLVALYADQLEQQQNADVGKSDQHPQQGSGSAQGHAAGDVVPKHKADSASTSQ